MIGLLFLASSALAGAGVDIDVGYSTRIGDPYAASHGVAAAAAFRLPGVPGNISLGAGFAFYPLLGQGGCSDPRWKPLSCQLLEKNSVSPTLSFETLRVGAFAQAAPFRIELGKRGMETGLRAGFAMVHTEDDLVAMQADDTAPDSMEHQLQSEWHPAPTLGWFGSFWMGSVGGGIHLDLVPYTETFGVGDEGLDVPVLARYFEIDLHVRL